MYVEKDSIDFEKDVIDASEENPVVVDFWAAWCGPCRALSPTLEKLAEEAGEDWTLLKVNTDRQPELAARFNIRGIPTVKLFSKGDVLSSFVGALPEDHIRRWLGDHLPAAVDRD